MRRIARRALRLARKTPYYGRSLRALTTFAAPSSVAGCVLGTSRRLRLRDGSTLLVSSRLDLLVVKECWADDVYGLWETRLADGDVVVDVGAGVGDFALAASAVRGVTVHAFEPNPRTFPLLAANVRRRGADVRVECIAIGTVGSYRLAGLSSGPRASAERGTGAGAVVEARRLDDVVPPGPVALLKVDCEGLELDVLESGPLVLERCRRVVVEYHRELLEDADQRVAELLASHGFATSLWPDPYDASIGYVDGRRVTRSTGQPVRTERL